MAINNPVQNAVKVGPPVSLDTVSPGDCVKLIAVDDMTGDGTKDILLVGVDVPVEDVIRETGKTTAVPSDICPFGGRYNTNLFLVEGVKKADGSIGLGSDHIELYSRAPLNWYRRDHRIFPPAIANVKVADHNNDGVMDIVFHTLVGQGQKYQQMVMYGKTKTHGSTAQSDLGIRKLYSDIDRLDGESDGKFRGQLDLSSHTVLGACLAAEMAGAAAATKFGETSEHLKISLRLRFADGREAEISCADLVKNIGIIVEALKKLYPYAQIVFTGAPESSRSRSEAEIRADIQRMPDDHKLTFITTTILDAILIYYVMGIEDSRTPVWQTMEREVDLWAAGEEILKYMPASWLVNGRLNKEKMIHGIMDILFTLGVESTGLIHETHRSTYKPKKMHIIWPKKTGAG